MNVNRRSRESRYKVVNTFIEELTGRNDLKANSVKGRDQLRKSLVKLLNTCWVQSEDRELLEDCDARLPIKEVLALLLETESYVSLFDLQWRRMNEATAMWRKATGQHNVSPDLGKLLEWLMEQIAEAKRGQKTYRKGREHG